MTLVLLPQMPASEDPCELELRATLGAADGGQRAAAALQLGGSYFDSAPQIADALLRIATDGPSLTAARARLQLARLSVREGRDRQARELLAAARAALEPARGADIEYTAVLIDVGAASAVVDREQAAEILQGVDRALEPRLSAVPTDLTGERWRRLAALTKLRLGEAMAGTDPAFADVTLSHAVAVGQNSLAAAAALERGRLLERHPIGNGADLEEQFRAAADFGDPIASPPALLCLGDLLWRHGAPGEAAEYWHLAAATGDAAVVEEVRLRHAGAWTARAPGQGHSKGNAAFAPATPVQGVLPQTELGRIASGRAPGFVPEQPRVVVVGGGTGGHYLLPGLRHEYDIVGFVDDNRDLTHVEEFPMLGGIDELEHILAAESRKGRISQVLFAIPTASGDTRRRVLRAAVRCGIEVRSLPSIFEVRRARPLVTQLRPIGVFETFGHFQWTLDRAAAGIVRARRVAIIGAGSSPLGRELARRVAHGQARHLLLLDDRPRALLTIAAEVSQNWNFRDCDPRIVNCTDALALGDTFAEFRPEIVFHAASLNYAPPNILPLAHAVGVNIATVEVAARTALEHGASTFVLVSADRAGHRASAFDLTKALAERAVLKLSGEKSSSGSHLRVSVLRLPNVWAKGSTIIDRLTAQLAAGGPIRADRTAARRFVTSWQAAEGLLRLVGVEHPDGVCVLNQGEEVSIRDLAERLIWINGLTSGLNMEIVDDTTVDPKHSLDLWGSRESPQKTPVATDITMIHQEPGLITELDRRLADVKAALATSNQADLIAALDVRGYRDLELAPETRSAVPAAAAAAAVPN